MVDSSGTVQNHITYDSFGQITSETNSSVVFRFGYTGREFDEETGQYYYRSRYYDASNGRFLSEDTIGFAGGDANLYRYVYNSPVTLVDASGRSALSAWGAGLVTTGLGISLLDTPVSPAFDTVGLPIAVVGLGLLGLDWLVNQFNDETQTINPTTTNSNSTSPSSRRPWSPQGDPSPVPIPLPSPNERTPRPNPNDCRRRRPCEGAIQGGSYRSVRTSNRNGGAQVHHMPAWNAIQRSGISLGQMQHRTEFRFGRRLVRLNDGFLVAPGICMEKHEHEATASHPYQGASATAYRERQANHITRGSFYVAQNMDIVDIQSQFDNKYDVGIIQMQNYTAILRAFNPQLFVP